MRILLLSPCRNELLEQYPELVEELEEVTRKIEAENKEYKAQAEELQQRLSNSTDKQDNAPGGVVGGAKIGDDEVDGLTISEAESTYDSHDIPASTQSDNEDVIIDNQSISEESPSALPGTDLESLDNSSSGKVDLTLANFVVDSLKQLLKQSKEDLNRILGVVVPVVKQFFVAGDKALRTLKALFVQVREAFESTNQSPSDPPETEDTSKPI